MTREEIQAGLGTWLAYFKEGKPGLTVEDGVEWIMGYLHSQDVGIKGQGLGTSHPHLAAYYTFEPLIDAPGKEVKRALEKDADKKRTNQMERTIC